MQLIGLDLSNILIVVSEINELAVMLWQPFLKFVKNNFKCLVL